MRISLITAPTIAETNGRLPGDRNKRLDFSIALWFNTHTEKTNGDYYEI